MRTIKDCNVVVVGGAGFLGSHLVNHLVEERNCRVLVLDNLCAGRREFIHTRADFEHLDIVSCSEEGLRTLYCSFDADYVFNYAAWPYVPTSYARPLHVFNVNAFGAMKVINAAQESSVKAILQVSSAEVYGAGKTYDPDNPREELAGPSPSDCYVVGPIDEGAPVVARSSYGSSKAAIDYYCQCSWKERCTPVIALRQFNCVGERETHPYVVPEIIGQLSKQVEEVVISVNSWHRSAISKREDPAVVRLGNNSARDFLYAGDAVALATLLLEQGEFGEVYNLGSESAIKIYDLAVLVGKVLGFENVLVKPDPTRTRPWEIWHLQSDNSKIKRVLGSAYPTQSSLFTLEEALHKTVQWFQKNGNKWPWEVR